MRRLLLLLLFPLGLFAQTTGTITNAGGTVTLVVPVGSTSVAVKVSGTFIASVTLEQSTDGSNFTAVGSMTYPSAVTFSIAVPTNTPAIISFRARGASYLSGIVNVSLTAGTATVSTGGITNVNITNLPIANFPATQPISGSVSIIGTVPVSVPGTIPVSGTFWQTTQPVSLATAPTTPVTGTFWQATQPVSGTFFQATQPVSLASVPTHAVTQSGAWSVSVSNFPATQPISAASLPLPTGAATAAKQPALGVAGTPSSDVISVQGVAGGTAQPVSGTVAVGNFPASQAVTGTFFQATQPVSGTFFQSTQPVSLATAPTTPVTGTFFQATQPVSLTTLPALVAGSAVIGHVIVDTAPTTAVTGTFFQATQPVSLASVPTHAVTQSGAWTVTSNQAPTTAAAQAVTPKAVAALSVQSIKASAGNVYGVALQNPNASVCWLQFYNTAGTPVLGTSVIWALPVPTSGTLVLPPADLAVANHTTGIGVGSATTPTGATACGTALAGTIFFF